MSDRRCGCSMIVTYVCRCEELSWATLSLGDTCAAPYTAWTARQVPALFCNWYVTSCLHGSYRGMAWAVGLGDSLWPLHGHTEQRAFSTKSLLFSGLGLSDCWDRTLSTEFLPWVTVRPAQRSCPFRVPSNAEPSNLSTHYVLSSALTSLVHWSPVVYICRAPRSCKML